MAPKIMHFMDEADIGSGEKTPAQLEDMEQVAHLGEDMQNPNPHGHPQDGSQLKEVVEEQQFVSEHENHTPVLLTKEIQSDQLGRA